MVTAQAEEILQFLDGSLVLPALVKQKADPFETLIITILSQNTADRNTAVAFKRLSDRLEISPEALENADTAQIEECIRVSGLYKSKAKAIQTVSKIVLAQFGGSLAPILALPLDEARRTLMEMPGVGPKTADVVLLFASQMPTIPVDTHVNRVSKRLGIAPENGDYEVVRKSLQSHFVDKDYLAVHLLLIGLGRQYCKAHNPLCNPCPVNTYCKFGGSCIHG